jgi:hypothetical protein
LTLDRSKASARGGIYAAGSGYTVAPPNGIPFAAIADHATGTDAAACGLDYWDTADTSGWGRFQAYPKGKTHGSATWVQASAPSEHFAAGSHTSAIDFSYICNSNAGCRGVESQGRSYGYSTLAADAKLTLDA